MPDKRQRRAPNGTAAQSAEDADAADSRHTKRLKPSRPAPFAQLPSAVLRLCVLSCLQLPELFELSHVSVAFTAVSRQAAVDWMQRAFASTVQHYSQLAHEAAEKEQAWQRWKSRQLEPGQASVSECEPAAAAAFSFTLSDARFVRGEMQRWGVAGSLSASRLSETEMYAHFKVFNGSLYLSQHVSGHRFVPSCSLHDVLRALFSSYGHVEAYLRWREKDAAKDAARQQRRELSNPQAAVYHEARTAREERKTASAAVEKRWRSGSSGRPLLHLLPDAVIGSAVFPFLEFHAIMDMRAVCSSLKPVCEREAVLWMAAAFPAGLATIAQQQQAEQEGSGSKKQKAKKQTGTTAHSSSSSSSSPSILPFLSSPVSSSPSTTTSERVPAAGAQSSASSPSSSSSVSSSSSPPSSSAASSSSSRPRALQGPPAASFSLADCVWLRRQLDRAESLRANEEWHRVVVGSAQRRALALSAAEAAEWYDVSKAELLSRSLRPVNRDSFMPRYSLLSIAAAVLERHGHAASFTQHMREKGGRRRVSAKQRERAERRLAVDAALAAEGLQAEWGPERGPEHTWCCQRVEFEWRKDGKGSWVKKPRKYWTAQGSPELHRALLALGMACHGDCRWGGCLVQANEKVGGGGKKPSSAD